uniref:Putative ribonuclease VapC6 n=1 Tax=Lygus hesperus TaxID=30085 RepID=A0A0A9ZCV5_LYGHE
MKDYVKNSVTLHATSDDGIPDINELAKDISAHGLRKIEEAQKILQQKLNDAMEEVRKTSNSIWKMFLLLMVDSLEEAICELGKIKEQVAREFQCQREQQKPPTEPPK